MARRRNRFASQAALEALVRFGPELSALKALQREAQSTYQQGIAQARGTARGVIAAVDEARPDVRGVYSRATAQHNALAGQVGADVGALGNVSNSIKAAIAGESGAAGSRIEESRAAALTGLSERKVAARTGQQFAVKAALRQLIGDLGKVYDRKVDLARERGAFTASTARELRQDAADRRLKVRLENMGNTQSERNSLRSAGINPETGGPIKGGPLDPNAARYRDKKGKGRGGTGGTSLQTRTKHAEWGSDIDEMVNWARKYKGTLTRGQIVEKLKKGRSQQRITTDPDTGQKLAVPVVLEKIPQFKPDLRMSAALDMALYGHLTRPTQQRLRRAGFSIDELGLVSWREGQRREKGRWGPH